MNTLFRLLTLALLFVTSLTMFAQCDADHVVFASNFSYEPNFLEVELGESVAFVNNGGYHDVNGDINSITEEPFGNPESFYLSPVSGNPSGVCIGVVTFTVAGTYEYDCSIGSHAQLGMVASINVSSAQVGGCTYAFACNYNPEAAFDDGSCEVVSCALQGDLNGDLAVTTSDLLIFLSVFGETL